MGRLGIPAVRGFIDTHCQSRGRPLFAPLQLRLLPGQEPPYQQFTTEFTPAAANRSSHSPVRQLSEFSTADAFDGTEIILTPFCSEGFATNEDACFVRCVVS
jgi:hypothetical protein